jgi:hypothetical protein
LSSCDVATAEQGKNPAPSNAPPGSADSTGNTGATSKTNAKDKAGAVGDSSNNLSRSQPSVIFGGPLSGTAASTPSTSASQLSAPYQPGAVFSLSA